MRLPGDTTTGALANWAPEPWYRNEPVWREVPQNLALPTLRSHRRRAEGYSKDPDIRGVAPASALAAGPISPEVVLLQVADRFGIAPEVLAGRSKQKDIVRARMLAMAECRRHGFSYPAIGRAFDRNHTTVMHACRIVAKELAR